MSVTLKPYPEYKDSGVPWLGKIPQHWNINPGFSVFREKQHKNAGMVETTVLSLSYGRIVVKPTEKLHGLVPASFKTYQIVDPGEIIIRPTDLQNDWNSLRVGIARNRGIITSAYLCLRTIGPLVSDYGYLLLHTYDLMKIFYGMVSGLRQNLDFTDLKRMPVMVPPREEQGRIVAFLTHFDQRINYLIRTKRRLIELLNEQKQGTIHRAVTRGLYPNTRLKPSGIDWLGDVPEHWEIWQIGHFAKVGNGSTPSRGNTAYWSDHGYPWLNSSSVNQGVITKADQFVTDLALRECHLPHVRPGSVLVAITGQGKTRGTAAVLAIEATINQHMTYISPKTVRVSSDYLQMYLTAAYVELRTISDDSGSTKGALTCEDVKHFKVALPPSDEQDRLVCMVKQELADIEITLTRIRREIDLLHEYRTRLIADVVTGQLDVRRVELPAMDEAEALTEWETDEDPEVDEMDAREGVDA